MEAGTKNNQNRKYLALTIFFVVAALAVAGTIYYIRYQKSYLTTDDAYVTSRIHMVASRIPGTVKAILVSDNQFVRQGKLLVKIDERDYDIRLREADAAVATEKLKLRELHAKQEVAEKQLTELTFSVATAKAGLRLQETILKQAEADLERARKLHEKKIIPEEKYEKTETGRDIALAQVESAREQLRQAEAALATQKALLFQMEATLQGHAPVIRQREEARKAEELKMSYTKIHAPADGYVTKRAVETGEQIQAGQALMAVVPLADVWVVANYKETQLERVEPGQKVRISVDTYPEKTFEGTVESIMAGTGSVFSLFPPENATGNYVKVVQRIPIKIVLKQGTDPEHLLRVGMSVIPTIIVGK